MGYNPNSTSNVLYRTALSALCHNILIGDTSLRNETEGLDLYIDIIEVKNDGSVLELETNDKFHVVFDRPQIIFAFKKKSNPDC